MKAMKSNVDKHNRSGGASHKAVKSKRKGIERCRSGRSSSPSLKNPIRSIVSLHNVDNDTYELEITFDALHGKRKVRVPRRFRDDPTQIVRSLLDAGALLPDDKAKSREFVGKSLARATRIRAITSRSGWHWPLFVLPGVTISAARDREGIPRFDPRLHQKTGFDHQSGKFRDWNDGLTVPCSASRFLTFSLALGFAGPIVKLLESELSEGAVFLLVGESGTGKTLACMAAQSVSGKAARSALITFDATPTAQQELFDLHNDGTLVLDEVGRIGGTREERRQHLDLLAYTAPSGRGRVRATIVQAEGLRNHTWTVLCLGSTEESVENQPGGPQRRRGAQVRLIELAIPPRKNGGIFDRETPKSSAKLADRAEKVLTHNYGLALRRFLRALVRDTEAKDRCLRAFNRFIKTTDKVAPGRDRRLASKFALVFAAGELAVQYGVAPWTTKHLRDAIMILWEQASVAIEGSSALAIGAVRTVQQLAADGTKMPKVKKGNPLPASALGLCRKSKNGVFEAVFVPERLAAEVGQREVDAAMAWLDKERVIRRDPAGNKKQQVRIVDASGDAMRQRCLVLDRGKLAALKLDP